MVDLSEREKRRTGGTQDETIYAAYVQYGYMLKEIADRPGVHYATNSRAIERVEKGGHICYCKTPSASNRFWQLL